MSLPTAEIKHTCYNDRVYEPSDVSMNRQLDLPTQTDGILSQPLHSLGDPILVPQDSFLLVDALQLHASRAWAEQRPMMWVGSARMASPPVTSMHDEVLQCCSHYLSSDQMHLSVNSSSCALACRVLEIGCGSGFVICSVALMLNAMGGAQPQLIAIDINPEACSATAQTLLSHKVGLPR